MEIAIDFIFGILSALLSILPLSPFIVMAEQIGQFDFLAFLNYFIPFDTCSTLLTSWLVCVGLYYIYLYVYKAYKSVKDVI